MIQSHLFDRKWQCKQLNNIAKFGLFTPIFREEAGFLRRRLLLGWLRFFR